MLMAGALLHLPFFSGVAGLFGQPAATEVAFAVDCAFLSAADSFVPEETARLLNLPFCSMAAFASAARSCAVSGTVGGVVVLVVELAARSVERAVNSNAVPRRHAIR